MISASASHPINTTPTHRPWPMYGVGVGDVRVSLGEPCKFLFIDSDKDTYPITFAILRGKSDITYVLQLSLY